jgi:hypothetical protein
LKQWREVRTSKNENGLMPRDCKETIISGYRREEE